MLPASAESAPPGEAAAQPVLVGAIVHGREVGTLEVLREGELFLLPVDDLSGLLGVALVQHGPSASLATPLGRVAVEQADLRLVGGDLYIGSRALSERLATPVSFDKSRWALDFDPPWRRDAGDEFSPRPSPRVPDILAPRSTLSGLGGRLTHTRFGDHSNLSGDLRLDGRLARGLWRVRLEDSRTTPFEVREYQWYTRRDRTSFLAGRQRLQLHSTLAGFDMAGLQVAWTNGDPRTSPARLDSTVMASAGGRPVESFHGEAPAGSFVQLRIEGRVRDSQQVGFSGFYRFDDVTLPSRQASEIEILIFDRHNRRVPVEVRRFRLAASNLLLPAGTAVHTGGVGRTGTFTRGFFDAAPYTPTSVGAFYQWRQGLNARMTGEAAVQYAAGRTQAYTGLISRLGRAWILGLGVSRTEGASGHSANVEGYGNKWRLYARSTSRPAEFELVGDGYDRSDHVAEWFHDTLPRLKLGVTGRLRDDGTRRSRYLLPSVAWHPVRSFHVDLRPDIYGDYQGNALWAASEATRARLFIAQTSHVEVTHDLDPRYQLGFDTSFGGGFDERHTLSITRRALSLNAWALKAGVVSTEGRLGYLVSASTPVLPGFHLQAEYQSIPFRSFVTNESLGRLLISISTDLSHVGGKFLPARSTQGFRERGSLAGRIVFDPGVEERLKGESWSRDLGQVRIVVDRRVRARTDSAGRFFVGSLPPGVYSVELDTENLPIQLSPVQARHLVEVKSGAVTRVDFPVRLELGLAGRVVGESGDPVPDVVVEVLDAANYPVARARTDRFGLYRVDGLPPGGYFLRATIISADGSERTAERLVQLTADFLFGQDLAPSDRSFSRSAAPSGSALPRR